MLITLEFVLLMALTMILSLIGSQICNRLRETYTIKHSKKYKYHPAFLDKAWQRFFDHLIIILHCYPWECLYKFLLVVLKTIIDFRLIYYSISVLKIDIQSLILKDENVETPENHGVDLT